MKMNTQLMVDIKLTEKEWNTIRDCVYILDNIMDNLRKYYDNGELKTDQIDFYEGAVAAFYPLARVFEDFSCEPEFTIEE